MTRDDVITLILAFVATFIVASVILGGAAMLTRS